MHSVFKVIDNDKRLIHVAEISASLFEQLKKEYAGKVVVFNTKAESIHLWQPPEDRPAMFDAEKYGFKFYFENTLIEISRVSR